jgi:hypothetical protein
MVAHSVIIDHAVAFGDSLVTVTNRHELGPALAHKTKRVIIADPKLARVFEVFLRVQRWLPLAALMAYAISQGYGVEFRHTEWKACYTTEERIILMPQKR